MKKLLVLFSLVVFAATVSVAQSTTTTKDKAPAKQEAVKTKEANPTTAKPVSLQNDETKATGEKGSCSKSKEACAKDKAACAKEGEKAACCKDGAKSESCSKDKGACCDKSKEGTKASATEKGDGKVAVSPTGEKK